MRRYIAIAGVVTVLSPLMALYGLMRAAEETHAFLDSRPDNWRWCGKLVDISERIERWSRDGR